MEEELPILDYIHRCEMADKNSVEAPVEPAGPVKAETDTHSLSLGSKTVDFQKREKVSRPPVLRTVQALHEPEGGTKRPPICYCGAPRLGDVDVHLREDGTGKKKAGVSGVWRCRNGEVCPICVEASTARRRDSYARVGDAAIEKGGCIVTVVLSVSHSLQDKLADLIRAVKKASTGARAGGPWHRKIKAALGALGVFVDHHVRYGDRYGWHYHQHLTIYCLNGDEGAIQAAIELLIERYVRLLAQQGYRADADRQHVKVLKQETDSGPYTYPADHNRVDDDDHVGNVVIDIDNDEEESLSPMMLAERAAHGDEQAAALFMEFSAAIKKTRSVVVTPAMARALEIDRQAEEPQSYNDQNRLGSIPGKVWVKLLDENLATTFLSRVEWAGRENWPAVRWWALEQTGEAPEYSTALANEIAELLHAQQRMPDPIARELAQDQIEILKGDWTVTHGTELVVGTVEYVTANHPHMKVDAEGVEIWVDLLEDNAGKIARRRGGETSRMPLTTGNAPPSPPPPTVAPCRETVPAG